MVDTNTVLTGQTLLYTFYVVVILLIMAWFSYALTHDQKATVVPPALFYSFAAFLIVLGVSLHLVTYHTIPWKEMDLNRAHITADKVFNITVANHKFNLPPEKMLVKTNEKVLFKVTSEDLTYGFGLFRQDNSMVFQMQVMPGHMNDVLWQFSQPGVFSIRSTEYSGPKGMAMIEKDVVIVSN
jgi:cytochrome c oxidase subunit 2